MARHPQLTRYALLSIGAALATIALKSGAYLLTGSVGLLADALESTINLIAAITAFAMLHIAARPADAEHAYGHSKAEYFAGAIEGVLIIGAAVGIGWAAIERLRVPAAIDLNGLGIAIALIATLINLVVARVLLRASQRYSSIALEADGEHLMSDVWTSFAVVIGLGLVALTGFAWLDPLIALMVAANIVRTGVALVRRSVLGLMDTALPHEEIAQIEALLAKYGGHHGIAYHALRSRQAAARRFVSFHLLVPDSWSVRQGHALAEEIEAAIRSLWPNTTVFTHLEPRDDPSSWADLALDR